MNILLEAKLQNPLQW